MSLSYGWKQDSNEDDYFHLREKNSNFQVSIDSLFWPPYSLCKTMKSLEDFGPTTFWWKVRAIYWRKQLESSKSIRENENSLSQDIKFLFVCKKKSAYFEDKIHGWSAMANTIIRKQWYHNFLKYVQRD